MRPLSMSMKKIRISHTVSSSLSHFYFFLFSVFRFSLSENINGYGLISVNQMRTACSFRMCSLRNACEGCKRKHNGHLNWNRLAGVRVESGTFDIGDIVSWAWACDTDVVDGCVCPGGCCLGSLAVKSWVFCIIIAHRIRSLILYWLVCVDVGDVMRLPNLGNTFCELAWKRSNSMVAPTWRERERKLKMWIKDRTKVQNFSIECVCLLPCPLKETVHKQGGRVVNL